MSFYRGGPAPGLAALLLPGGAVVLELLFPGGAELFPVGGLAVALSGVSVLLALFPGELAPGVVAWLGGACLEDRPDGDEGEPASARRMG